MLATYPLTIYYDASCPLCLEEMQALKQYDAHERLQLIDCSAPGFSDSQARQAGLHKDVLMLRIHARDASGQWLDGVTVFEAAYQAAGIESMARFWGHPWLRPLLDRAYPWVARNRMLLSRLRLTRLFGFWVKFMARRAARRSRGCLEQVCERN